jgi:hypothetical protein
MIANRNRPLKSDKPENLYEVTHRGSLFRYCDQFSGFLFRRNGMGKFKRAKKTLPIFYNYLIIEEKTNTPIYVGKGHKDRVLSSNNEYSKIIGEETIYKFPFARLKEKEAYELEKDLIFTIGRKDKGEGPLLNKADGGYGGGRTDGFVGKIHSEETRIKMGLSHKGKRHSKETKNKMSLSHKGKKFSKEHGKKISIALKGHKISDEIKKKISFALKGRVSPNKGRKYPEGYKGRKVWNKGRRYCLLKNSLSI